MSHVLSNDILEYIGTILLREYDMKVYAVFSSTSKFLLRNQKKNVMITKMNWNQTFSELKLSLVLGRNTQDAQLKQQIENSLNTLIASKTTNKSQIVADHAKVLSDIQVELESYIRGMPKGNDKIRFTQIRDKLFSPNMFGIPKALQDSVDSKKAARRVTEIFNSFLKGVTYFSNETVFSLTEPVYHRLGSCPNKGNKNYECVHADNAKNAPEVEALEKCYTERLIYDHLWAELTQCQQDAGHLLWQLVTRDAYAKCFPERTIKVELEYNERRIDNSNVLVRSKVPLRLIVNISGPDYLRVDTYIKTWDDTLKVYDEDVICTRVFNGITYYKLATFTDAGVWFPPYTGGKKKRQARATKKII